MTQWFSWLLAAVVSLHFGSGFARDCGCPHTHDEVAIHEEVAAIEEEAIDEDAPFLPFEEQHEAVAAVEEDSFSD